MSGGFRQEQRGEDATQEPRAPSGAAEELGSTPRLAVVERRPDELAELRSELRDHGFQVEAHLVDRLSLTRLRELDAHGIILGPELLTGVTEGFLSTAREALPGCALMTLLERDAASATANLLELGLDEVLSRSMSAREVRARVRRCLRLAQKQRALLALAQTDGLTGLANYRALRARAEEEHKRATRYGYPLAAVMLDLDRLKELNDRLGHEIGNRAIQTFANYLRANLRDVDFAARFGGDEFVVLLPHQSAQEARVFAERLRVGLAQLRVRDAEGRELPISLTLSAGIADHLAQDGMRDPEALLTAADRALYVAKQTGRNRISTEGSTEH